MYFIEYKVFGKYVEVDWSENETEAREKAYNYHRYGGWLNVRIVMPTGEIVQVYGE